MPIYEYRCRDCDHTFQELVRSAEREPEVRCAACESAAVERLLSVFGVFGGESSRSPGARPEGPCGSGCACFPE